MQAQIVAALVVTLLPVASSLSVPTAAGYVTPIGPFCPFRSSATSENGPLGVAMSGLTSDVMPRFASEMARLQLTMQTGGEPDLARVAALADDLTTAEADWRALLTRMRGSTDFQSLEYFKLMEAWTTRQGESMESIGLMMRWQADCMRAFAAGQPPLPPPPGIDLDKLMQQQQQGGAQASNPMAQVSAAQSVTSAPFNEADLDTDVVRGEYAELCKAHAGIVKLGEGYGGFDPLGKCAYLDALAAVEERWDVFFARFALMGCLNPTFKEQTDDFLGSMGMSADVFREVLREAHEEMRSDAERERGVA